MTEKPDGNVCIPEERSQQVLERMQSTLNRALATDARTVGILNRGWVLYVEVVHSEHSLTTAVDS